MNNPVTYAAGVLIVLGIIVFWAGITEKQWLPGAKGARQREQARKGGEKLMGFLEPSSEQRAMEAHTDALQRHADEMAAERKTRE